MVLSQLMQIMWTRNGAPEEWLIIIRMFKKGERTCCENHVGISLVSIASKLVTGVILCGLRETRWMET